MEHAKAFAALHPGEYDKELEACRALSGDELFESEAFCRLKDDLVAYALPLNIQGLRAGPGQVPHHSTTPGSGRAPCTSAAP